MAIDSSALTSIKNAIASYSGSESTYSDKLKNDANNSVNSLAQKASSFATKSRYKAAFEEKMKIANESSDTVEISKESLAALKKYNQTEVSAAAKKDSSSSSGYTYDYQSIKKKNLENIAAIEKEVAQKYGKKTDAADSTTKTADDKSTVKSDDSTKTESTTDGSSSDKTTASDKTTDSKKSENTTDTEKKTTSYSYDYNAMKAKDAENASKIEAEVKAQYSGHNSPDDIVNQSVIDFSMRRRAETLLF